MTGEQGRPPPGSSLPLPASKLRPATERWRRMPARLLDALRPGPGRLTLVHAAAGYGKTTALAAADEPGSTWYNLDAGDRDPATFARRLGQAMGLRPPAHDSTAVGDLAWALAGQLQGTPVRLTLDRWERLELGREVGRLLDELILLAPSLTVRLATRTRPALPLERLRLEGRLIDVGPGDLRLQPAEIAGVLTAAWGRPPNPAELDFADTVLAGWPAGLRLWLSGLGSSGPLTPLVPGQLLHEYFHEQVLGTLPEEVQEQMRREWRWLLRPGPLLERATTTRRRELVSRLVRERVAVVPGPGGWHLHPLMLAFERHAARGRGGAPPDEPDVEEAATSAGGRVSIRTFGGLSVLVDGVALKDADWPAASRRLLELLLSVPCATTTAEGAARLLWPGAPERAARNSFNVALHGLRRALEPGLSSGVESRYVVREGREYRLCVERLQCDVEEFTRLVSDTPVLDEAGARRLRAAVRLHTGDFLASSVERFAASRRADLRALLMTCAERLGKWQAETDGDGLASAG